MNQTEQHAIQARLDGIQQAWNAADAHAFAEQFTEDATYVIFLGDALRGRKEIESTHVDVLTKWQKGTRMKIKLISMRKLGDGIVSVLTAGGIGKGSDVKFDKLQTFTMVLRDDKWSCASFQNTAMSDRAKKEYNLPDSASTKSSDS